MAATDGEVEVESGKVIVLGAADTELKPLSQHQLGPFQPLETLGLRRDHRAGYGPSLCPLLEAKLIHVRAHTCVRITAHAH